ncbi:hypothetical protein OG279_11925 [Streptomyces sp. NBC_01201]|uniref:hypothetical protein n=1 Tax=Streptomyces sp. NBC_01201 TaxID=2903770 RepID=UPI002E0F76C5|nr:hypothetical protein OG279_11925 [Streptomyces sp. NBC_01201]
MAAPSRPKDLIDASGIPVTITAPVAEHPERGTSSRGRRGPAPAARRRTARQTFIDAAAA